MKKIHSHPTYSMKHKKPELLKKLRLFYSNDNLIARNGY
jgi:hypothetical protein